MWPCAHFFLDIIFYISNISIYYLSQLFNFGVVVWVYMAQGLNGAIIKCGLGRVDISLLEEVCSRGNVLETILLDSW